MPPQSPVVDDEYGLEPAKPAAGVTDDKYGLEPAEKPSKPVMAPGSFQQRKGGPILNANATGIQGQSPKQVSTNLKADAAAGSRIGPGTTPQRITNEATLGAASGFSGMPETSTPLTDFGKSLESQQEELMEHPVKTIAKQTLLGPAPQLYDLGKGLAESSGEIGSGVIHRDPEKVAHGGGSLIGRVAQLGVLEEAPETVGRSSTILPSKGQVAVALRNPETGALKPSVRAAARMTGATAGHAAGIPGMGELGGFIIGPTVADALIPNLPHDVPLKVSPGGPLPDAGEFYAHRAEDLAKRGKEQAKIDTVNEGKLKEAEQTRQQQLADRGKLEMQDATEQAAAIRRQQVLDAKAGKAPKQSALGSVQLPTQLQGSSTLSTAAGGPSPEPTTVAPMTPPQTMPIVRTKAEIAAAAAGGEKNAPIIPGGKIVGPEADPLDAKTTYQSYDRPKLVEMAKRGDRNAYLELLRNPAGTDLTQFKYQYGYGAPGNPVYQPKPFRNYDVRGNVEVPRKGNVVPLQKPTIVRKPIPAEGPDTVAPMKPPNTGETVTPMQKPVLKGGINAKGVEESTRPRSPEEEITALSGEIERMRDRLRASGASPEEEKAALGNQIREYEQRLGELRKTANKK